MRIFLRKNNNKRGISIIEVIVAIYLISMGMIGLLSLMVQALQAKKVNTDTVIASMLAQEGLELVRNIRDTNWLNGATGDEWKEGGGVGLQDIVLDGDYSIYINSSGNITINGTINDINNAKLYLDANNFYVHTVTTDPSLFFRLIKVIDCDSNNNTYIDNNSDCNGNDDDTTPGDHLIVECTVRWAVKNSYNEYVATTYLYNWR